MAESFDFPPSPSVGEIYQPTGSDISYFWTGTTWNATISGTGAGVTLVTAGTGLVSEPPDGITSTGTLAVNDTVLVTTGNQTKVGNLTATNFIGNVQSDTVSITNAGVAVGSLSAPNNSLTISALAAATEIDVVLAADKSINIGADPAAPTIKLDGDGTASFAAGDILINDDGSGAFTGPILSGPGDPRGGVGEGSCLNMGSGIVASYSFDNSPLFRGYKQGNSTPTSQINVDGSATFAGDVTIGDPNTGTFKADNLSAARTYQLPNADGTLALTSNITGGAIEFVGAVDITGTAPTTPLGGIWVNDTAGNANASFDGLNEQFIALNQLVFLTDSNGWVAGGVTDPSTYVTVATTQIVSGQKSFSDSVKIGGTLPTTPNINLATDGSAEFKGIVKAQSAPGVTTDLYQGFGGTSQVYALDESGNISLGSNVTSAATTTINLNVDGSATFTGEINTNNDNGIASDEAVSIKNSRIYVRSDSGTSASNAFAAFKGGDTASDIVAKIAGDGSASFSGDVTVANGTGPIGLIKDDGRIELFSAQPYLVCKTGTNDTAGTKITLANDGSASFAGAVNSPRVNLEGAGTDNILVGYADSDSTSILRADGKLSLGNLSGGGNIVLNGADGSASFAGDVISGPLNTGSNTGKGVGIYGANGAVYAQRSSDQSTLAVWQGFAGTTPTSTIKADGSASLAGNVETNGYLYANGAGSYLVVNRTGATGNTTVAELGGDTVTSRIAADGSASFAGDGLFGDPDGNYIKLDTVSGALTVVSDTTTTNVIQYGRNGAAPLFFIGNDGGASFSDSISVNRTATTSTSALYLGQTQGTEVFKVGTDGYLDCVGLTDGTTSKTMAQVLEDDPGVQADVIRVLLVAGGGGAGNISSGKNAPPGAGGGGGMITQNILFLSPISYNFTVGAGGIMPNGTDRGGNGGNTTFGQFTAIGGGGGALGGASSAGLAGGSGGGGSGGSGGGAGTPGQGNNGGSASGNISGGGGGAGQPGGGTAGDGGGGVGGDGLASNITGTSVFYAGGGGGGWWNDPTNGAFGAGGQGGGGNGASLTENGQNGTDGLGGGGGAGNPNATNTGGNGGSGILIISIGENIAASFTGGTPTTSTDGSRTVYTVNFSGSVSFSLA